MHASIKTMDDFNIVKLDLRKAAVEHTRAKTINALIAI